MGHALTVVPALAGAAKGGTADANVVMCSDLCSHNSGQGGMSIVLGQGLDTARQFGKKRQAWTGGLSQEKQ